MTTGNELEVSNRRACPYVIVKGAIGPRNARGWLKHNDQPVISQEDCLTLYEMPEGGNELEEAICKANKNLSIVVEILNRLGEVSKCDTLIGNGKMDMITEQPVIGYVEPFDVVIENEPCLRKVKRKIDDPTGPLSADDRKDIFYLSVFLSGNLLIEDYEEESRRYGLNIDNIDKRNMTD